MGRWTTKRELNEAIAAAEARKRARRSEAAREAALTRRARQQHRVADAARHLVAGHGIGARPSCAICGRSLGDPLSVRRGVGPECWQGVLAAVDRLKTQPRPGQQTNTGATS